MSLGIADVTRIVRSPLTPVLATDMTANSVLLYLCLWISQKILISYLFTLYEVLYQVDLD